MIPRLFIDQPLSSGADITLEKDQAHYLIQVLRRKTGDEVRLFNGCDGEWTAGITEAGKRAATLRLTAQTRPQHGAPDLTLYFAPVKKTRTDFIVEKATELGAARIIPVFTEFTQSERVRSDRLQALAREAAEQTERLGLPVIGEAITLEAMLADREADRPLIFCDEGGDVPPLLEALKALVTGAPTHNPSPEGEGDLALRAPSKLAVLIGPEGGFSDAERARLRETPGVTPVSLGPRILRADTAAAAALTLIQAVWGDWEKA